VLLLAAISEHEVERRSSLISCMEFAVIVGGPAYNWLRTRWLAASLSAVRTQCFRCQTDRAHPSTYQGCGPRATASIWVALAWVREHLQASNLVCAGGLRSPVFAAY